MKTAIASLRSQAEEYRTGEYCSSEAFVAMAKECEDAADLLEKLTTSAANQAAPSSTQSTQRYADRDALMTMAMFVGLPAKVSENFIGLILYIKELEERASKETPK